MLPSDIAELATLRRGEQIATLTMWVAVTFLIFAIRLGRADRWLQR
ncbi:MAG: hypothetical protein R3C53_07225 [Pirellulaceae bacterium]